MTSSDHQHPRLPLYGSTGTEQPDRRVIRPGVLGPAGEPLVVVQAEAALDQLLEHHRRTAGSPDPVQRAQAATPPSPARRVRVRAWDRHGRTYEGICSSQGLTSLFLELTPLPAEGVSLDLMVSPSGDPGQGRRATGIVAWVCPRPDEYGYGTGAGVTLNGRLPDEAGGLNEAGCRPEPRPITGPA